jgi:hypothetical protein
MNDLHFSRRAAPPTEKSIWWARLYEWRGVLIVVPVIAAMIAMMFSREYWEMRDHSNSPVQTGQAVVRSMHWINGGEGESSGWDIVLQINGQTLTPNRIESKSLDRVNVGDTVTVLYRTGRSGHIYVSHVAEIADPVKHRVGTNQASR